MNYILLFADYKASPKRIDLPTDSRGFLHTCYSLIDCDCIEVVSTWLPDIVLIVDESGKLKDDWVPNLLASMLYPSPFDPIAGTAIIARRDGPDIIPLTDTDIAILSDFYGLAL